MDYEKAYKEAFKRAREALNDGTINSNTIAYLQNIFPELAESEDERIRKDIISYIKVSSEIFPQLQKDNWIEWLEKQAPKSKWSEEDDYNVQCCVAKAERDITNGCPGRNKELIEWLKSLKQKIGGQQ